MAGNEQLCAGLPPLLLEPKGRHGAVFLSVFPLVALLRPEHRSTDMHPVNGNGNVYTDTSAAYHT